MKNGQVFFKRNDNAKMSSIGLVNTIALANFEGFDYSTDNTNVIIELSKLADKSPERIKRAAEFARNSCK